MFSQTVEYALRAVAHLAQHSPKPQTTTQIADATQIPPAYLSKVIQKMNRQDLVLSKRGSGGGVSLKKTPDKITVFEVVNAVDPICRIEECPLGRAAHKHKLCPLHQRLDEAMGMVEKTFKNTKISEILNEIEMKNVLCVEK
jgi:Rrf2 family transcriptional regulator, nitric oxide-sensitive transcriptional repressor